MKQASRKEWISETGYRYEFIVPPDEETVIVFFNLRGAGESGYEFPTEGTQIKWEAFPQNAALVGDDVKEAAQLFFKTSRLKTFW